MVAMTPKQREALEESNSLLVALLHEARPPEEIMSQIADNRAALVQLEPMALPCKKSINPRRNTTSSTTKERSETMTPQLPIIYRINVAMAHLGISRTQLYRLVNAGKLELVKLGPNSSGITSESVRRFVDSAIKRN